LHKLDSFLLNGIIKRYEKGVSPQINNEFLLRTKLKSGEKKLPTHLQKKIIRSRRREVDKQGIKRIVENENYIRIKYVDKLMTL